MVNLFKYSPHNLTEVSAQTIIYVYGSIANFTNLEIKLYNENLETDLSSYIRKASSGTPSYFFLIYPTILVPKQSYILSIIDNSDGSSTDVSFKVKGNSIYIDPQEKYKYSVFSQLMANEFPDWTEARQNKYSAFQQLINPIANKIEDLYNQINQNSGNFLPQTLDPNTLDIINFIDLDFDYVFKQYKNTTGQVYYAPPLVKGIDGDDIVSITLSGTNSVDDLNRELPNRIDFTEEDFSGNIVLNSTLLSPIPIENFEYERFPEEENLYIKISDGIFFLFLEDRVQRFCTAYLEGLDIVGNKVRETIFILENTIYKTTHKYYILEKICFTNVHQDNSGTVEVFLTKPALERIYDNYIARDPNTRDIKPTIWEIENNGYGSCLVQKSYVDTDNIYIDNNLDAVNKYELLNKSGQPITVVDFTTSNFDSYIYITDGSSLFLYDKREDYSNKVKLLAGKSDEPVFVLDIEQNDFIRQSDDGGKLVTLNIVHQILDYKVKDYFIKVVTPTNKEFYVDINGALQKTKTLFKSTYDEEGLVKITPIDLVLTDLGSYMIELHSDLGEEIISIDKKIVTCYYKTPIAEYSLLDIKTI